MIHPRGFTVLVKPIDVEEDVAKKKEGSLIYIPESVKDAERVNVHIGTVLAIGNCAFHGLGNGAPWCSVGDKIIYAQFGGKFVHDGNEKLVLIQDKDVMAVVEE